MKVSKYLTIDNDENVEAFNGTSGKGSHTKQPCATHASKGFDLCLHA